MYVIYLRIGNLTLTLMNIVVAAQKNRKSVGEISNFCSVGFDSVVHICLIYSNFNNILSPSL